MSDAFEKLVQWDGKLPLWGLILLGVAWSGYQWNEIQELKQWRAGRDASAIVYRARIDELYQQQHRVIRLEETMLGIKSSIDRIEKKLDTPRQ